MKLCMFAAMAAATACVSASVFAAVEIDTDTLIRQNRLGTIIIKARPGTEVNVQQQEHEFWFGTAINARTLHKNAQYRDTLKTYFNSAVCENAMKWVSLERNRDHYTWENADRIADWCRENGFRMRGHAVFIKDIFTHRDWINEISLDELREEMEEHGKAIVDRYKDIIFEWDFCNELTRRHEYHDRFGFSIYIDMIEWMREAFPPVVSYYNDNKLLFYDGAANDLDTLSILMEDYGVPIGGIGAQAHFWEPVPDSMIWANLDLLCTLGLPIKITEFDLAPDYADTASSPEKDSIHGVVSEAFYRLAFAHPGINGLLHWGFWNGAQWLGRGIWRRDWSRRPAADVYTRLVRDEWWTDTTVKANADGEVRLPVWYGTHLVRIGGREGTVHVKKGKGPVTVKVTRKGIRADKQHGGMGFDRPEPVVRFTITQEDSTVRTVTFEATASSHNGAIESLSWDFEGDGSIDASGRSVSHTYPDKGTFYPHVYAIDAAGSVGYSVKPVHF